MKSFILSYLTVFQFKFEFKELFEDWRKRTVLFIFIFFFYFSSAESNCCWSDAKVIAVLRRAFQIIVTELKHIFLKI